MKRKSKTESWKSPFVAMLAALLFALVTSLFAPAGVTADEPVPEPEVAAVADEAAPEEGAPEAVAPEAVSEESVEPAPVAEPVEDETLATEDATAPAPAAPAANPEEAVLEPQGGGENEPPSNAVRLDLDGHYYSMPRPTAGGEYWYYFDLSAPSEVFIEYTWYWSELPSTAFVEFNLYGLLDENSLDRNVRLIASEIDRGDYTRRSGSVGLPAGRYYLCVSGETFGYQAGQFLVEAQSNSSFEQELNDMFPRALDIGPNEWYKGGCATSWMSATRDTDYWCVTIPEDSTVWLEASTYGLYDGTSTDQVAVVLQEGTVAEVGGTSFLTGLAIKCNTGNTFSSGSVDLEAGTYAVRVTAPLNACSYRFQVRATPAAVPNPPAVEYRTHVQKIGWQAWQSSGTTAGTIGQGLRLEAIQIKLGSSPYSGTVQYRTHVQKNGWEGEWRTAGETSGSYGAGLRLEAIQIRLTDQLASHYDIYYRVHAQHFGWMGWAKNGEFAGTAGYGYRLEAIQIRIVPKGSSAPGSTANPYREARVQYRTHVQRVGWQGWKFDGEMSGTSGQSLRLEGIEIKLPTRDYSGGITYRTHVQRIGWQGWRSDGAMSGTSGQALRLEAIQIKLTGEMANHYDVYYRVHAQHFGWMGWAKNGQSAGTAGYAYRLEGIEIRLVPKGGAAPGSTANAFREK